MLDLRILQVGGKWLIITMVDYHEGKGAFRFFDTQEELLEWVARTALI